MILGLHQCSTENDFILMGINKKMLLSIVAFMLENLSVFKPHIYLPLAAQVVTLKKTLDQTQLKKDWH